MNISGTFLTIRIKSPNEVVPSQLGKNEFWWKGNGPVWLPSKAIEPAGITHLIYFHGQKDNADSFHEAVYHQFSTLSTLILSIAYCLCKLYY